MNKYSSTNTHTHIHTHMHKGHTQLACLQTYSTQWCECSCSLVSVFSSQVPVHRLQPSVQCGRRDVHGGDDRNTLRRVWEGVRLPGHPTLPRLQDGRHSRWESVSMWCPVHCDGLQTTRLKLLWLQHYLQARGDRSLVQIVKSVTNDASLVDKLLKGFGQLPTKS